MKNNLILILAHSVNDSLIELFEAVHSAQERNTVVKILLHREDGCQSVNANLPENAVTIFGNMEIQSIGVPFLRRRIVPGSHHFPLYYVYESLFPGFEFYWLIEYDVRFSGDWQSLFSYFDADNSDLLCAHLATYRCNPAWHWWKLEKRTRWFSYTIPRKSCVRCFLPVMRLSNRAIGKLLELQRRGWRGHPEVLVPTLLMKNKMKVTDIGGEGEFVSAQHRNRFYIGKNITVSGGLSEGTMRHRPVHTSWGAEPNKLYHPVKEQTTVVESRAGM